MKVVVLGIGIVIELVNQNAINPTHRRRRYTRPEQYNRRRKLGSIDILENTMESSRTAPPRGYIVLAVFRASGRVEGFWGTSRGTGRGMEGVLF